MEDRESETEMTGWPEEENLKIRVGGGLLRGEKGRTNGERGTGGG